MADLAPRAGDVRRGHGGAAQPGVRVGVVPWTGVPAGTDYGLYRSATGPTPARPLSQEAGLAARKELSPTAANTHWDPVTESSWIYDGTNFWTGDTPQAIRARASYAADKGLAGMFAFSLENDDASGTLLNAMTGSLG